MIWLALCCMFTSGAGVLIVEARRKRQRIESAQRLSRLQALLRATREPPPLNGLDYMEFVIALTQNDYIAEEAQR